MNVEDIPTPRALLAVVAVAAVAVALAQGGAAPAMARHSLWLWRMEIAVASWLILWVVARLLTLSYFGLTPFERVNTRLGWSERRRRGG